MVGNEWVQEVPVTASGHTPILHPRWDLHIREVVGDVDGDGRVNQCLRLQWSYRVGRVVDVDDVHCDVDWGGVHPLCIRRPWYHSRGGQGGR